VVAAVILVNALQTTSNHPVDKSAKVEMQLIKLAKLAKIMKPGF
jgi:hypothetical protein